MDKLKYIKLEREDGTYSDSIPLSVDSDHVDINGNTLTNELSSKASNSDVNLKVSNLQSQISSLASGNPLVASDISEMIDTTRVYVNITDGHWYYYDGDSWEDGGVYQSSTDYNDIQYDLSKTIGNIYNASNNVNGGYYNSSGEFYISSGTSSFCVTEKIPVTKDDLIMPVNLLKQAGTHYVIYNSNNEILEVRTQNANLDNIFIKLPNDTASISFSLKISDASNFKLYKYNIVDLKILQNYSFNNVNRYYLEKKWGYIGTNGNSYSTGSTTYTHYKITLKKGEFLYIPYDSNHSYSGISIISKWNSSYLTFNKYILAGVNFLKDEIYEPTEDIEYLIVSTYSVYDFWFIGKLSEISNLYLKKKAFDNAYNYVFENVLCIGDSVTEGGTVDIGLNSIKQNYPYYLAKMSNCRTYNAGFSGYTASDWYSQKASGFNYLDYDTVMICLGINGGLTDTLATDVNPYDDYNDYADTNTGNYCKIIEKIKEQNSEAMIIIIEPWSEASNGNTTREVCKKIADKYSLLYISTYTILNGLFKREYRGNTNTVHPQKIGYFVLAKLIIEQFNKYISINPLFANVCMTARENRAIDFSHDNLVN